MENLSLLPNVTVVGEANDVVTAQKAINDLEFDLAIYDIRMPNGSGIRLIGNTKKKQPTPKVIMMTNYSIGHYKDKCLGAGADYFFDKADLDKMMTLIEQLSKEE